MGKKSLYLILSLTSAIVLFGISAICNFCPEQPASDDSLAGIETGTSMETVSDSIALSVEESEEAEPEASAPDFEEESSTPTVSEDTGEASSPEIHRVSLPRKDNESGYLIMGESPYRPGANIFYIGDSGSNNPSRGFISFDISALSSITVLSAQFSANPNETIGDAASLFPISIFVADWGDVSIYTCSFEQPGIPVGNCTSQNISCSTEALKNELMSKITAGEPRFQMMIYFTGAETNSNGQWDGYSYGVPFADLSISYMR